MSYQRLMLKLVMAIFRRLVERRKEPTVAEANLMVEADEFLDAMERAER